MTRDVILVGGGHTHVQVLEAWADDPAPEARLTVVVDRPVAVYSGMVPGFVAGQYRARDLEIDVRPLARRAGARVVEQACVAVNLSLRRLALADGTALAYDAASFDVGSTVAGLDLPGVREHTLAPCPIGRFVSGVDDLVARADPARPFTVVVVGGGAAGVELAFAFDARLDRAGVRERRVVLLEAGEEILSGMSAGVRRRVRRHARARGIEIRRRARVREVHADRVDLDDGETVPCGAVVWVTGAAAVDLFRASGVSHDHGFARIRETLQLEQAEHTFAVGDCASLTGRPLPKAGVYAVRQGPTLSRNLRAWLDGRRLERYRPQRDFLALLNLGDGRAIGTKWSLSFEGRWVFGLKDRIDRRFVRRFQVDEGGGSAESRAAAPGARRSGKGGPREGH